MLVSSVLLITNSVKGNIFFENIWKQSIQILIILSLLTWIGFFRAWWDHTVVGHFVVQGVGKSRRPILIDGHGRVVGEVGLVHHFKHVVTADLSRQVKCYDKWWRMSPSAQLNIVCAQCSLLKECKKVQKYLERSLLHIFSPLFIIFEYLSKFPSIFGVYFEKSSNMPKKVGQKWRQYLSNSKPRVPNPSLFANTLLSSIALFSIPSVLLHNSH